MTLMVAIRTLQLISRVFMRCMTRLDRELREFLQVSFVDPYHCGLLVQAEHLYRNSELFKIRLEKLGYMPAVDGFHDGVAAYFFEKARTMPRHIRFRIWSDAMLGRKPRTY